MSSFSQLWDLVIQVLQSQYLTRDCQIVVHALYTPSLLIIIDD